MHAIKIEDLHLEQTKADLMVETFRKILEEIGFHNGQIENIECRSRSGFIPYSHNKGGIEGSCFTQNTFLYGCGYDYGDDIIQKWADMQHDLYKKEHPGKFKYINQVQEGKRPETTLYQRVLDHYYEFIDGCSDYDSTMFSVRFMVLNDGSIDVDVFGSTMDAPYFRSSDYNEYKNFTFNNSEDFKKQALEFLEKTDIINLINE